MKAMSAFFSAILLLPSLTTWAHPQGENDRCNPAEVKADPNAGCVKALTGCVCVFEGSGSIWSAGYCLGCWAEIHGTLNCNPAHLTKPVNRSLSTDCGGPAAFGINCPCTGQPFFPYTVECGPCTEMPG